MQKRDYKNNPHVMLDLETLGVAKDAVVCSVGAVVFNPDTGELKDEFHQHVDWQSALTAGRTITASTVQWWLGQSDEARKALIAGTKNALPWNQVLDNFAAFFPRWAYVWGNGATFDVTLMETGYACRGKGYAPWSFGNVRDVRTIQHLAAPFYPEVELEGVAHDALADAKHQAQVVSAMWQHLKKQ